MENTIIKKGDLLIHESTKMLELVIASEDENYLIQNEVYALLGNFGCDLYRKITDFNEIQLCWVFIYKGEIYRRIKHTY